MNKLILLRCAGCCMLLSLCLLTHAQVPQLKINDRTDPNVYLSKLSIDGEQQVKVTGPATVMAEIFTHYAEGREERRIITLQMEKIDKNNGVMVGEFAFAR